MVKKTKTKIYLIPFQFIYHCLLIIYTPIYLFFQLISRIFFYENIDKLDGYQFERYVGDLLKADHFYDISLTQSSNDYGIDILAKKGKDKYAIQCKKYSSKVGVHAVQQVSSGCLYYQCDHAIVITNSVYTSQAITLANSLHVLLWDGAVLKKLINQKQTTKKRLLAFAILTLVVVLWYT